MNLLTASNSLRTTTLVYFPYITLHATYEMKKDGHIQYLQTRSRTPSNTNRTTEVEKNTVTIGFKGAKILKNFIFVSSGKFFRSW